VSSRPRIKCEISCSSAWASESPNFASRTGKRIPYRVVPLSRANHSCAPNCEMRKCIANGQSRLGLFAIRYIPKWEQLTFKYRGQVGFVGNCRCESCLEIYCTCEDIEYGPMIACDNEECPYEWFHWGCEDVREEPVGKWFCSTCRKT
jgi:SET domain